MAKSSTSILTGFGVELELTFAFREDLLVKILEQRHLTRDHIVKQLPTAVRKTIGLRHHGRPPLYLRTRPGHRGWVLRIDQVESPKDWQANGENRANVIGKYRTYWTEPLYIVQRILRNLKNYTIDVEFSAKSNSKPTYREWKVVNDHSLVPADKAEMKAALGHRISEEDLDLWDNTGLELVSPIMHRLGNDIDFDEIRLYLETLEGNKASEFGIFPSKYGSVHVHVGFAESTNTLIVLQHLAFIMLQYEPLLIKLFPFHRNGSHIANFRDGLCREDTMSNQEKARAFEFYKNPLSSGTIDDLGHRVFSTQSVMALCIMMQFSGSGASPQHGTKGHLVNFINIARAEEGSPSAKRTVEFRHHESTSDPNAIKMWVKLVLRICDAAQGIAASEQSAKGPQRASESSSSASDQRRKYKSRPSNLNYVHPIQDLFELIGLGDDASLETRDSELRYYWQGRYDQYHDATDGLQPSPDLPDYPTAVGVEELVKASVDTANVEEQASNSIIESGATAATSRSNSEAFTNYRSRHSPSSEEDDDEISMGGGIRSRLRRRQGETGSQTHGELKRGRLSKGGDSRKPSNKRALQARVLRSGKKY